MRAAVIGCGLVLAVAAAVIGCASLPPLPPHAPSLALQDTAGTRLGSAVVPLAAAHPGLSGVYPLAAGRDAFAARAALAYRAERSIDLQYYIWRKDLTGLLLLDALRSAAARGVRVRLLLDDNNTAGLDPVLAELDRDPNIEVRLFNPFPMRRWRSLGYLGEFGRLNRRMHNKSFTVDNQVTIVGGRNIGDEYFDAAGDLLFVDLDVMAIGPVVQAVSHDFDRYWNSRSAYPVSSLVGPAGDPAPPTLEQELKTVRGQPAGQAYIEAIRSLPFVEQLAQRRLNLEWATTQLISDDPDKVLDRARPEAKLAPRLRDLLGEPRRRSTSFRRISSLARTPPVRSGTWRRAASRSGFDQFTGSDRRCCSPRGYAKWRRALLESGVSLFELRRVAGDTKSRTRTGPLGSSGSSLHAKTFGVDGGRVFVGSFNLDPRSIELNTEMGFVIDSAALARDLDARLTNTMPHAAYEVKLDQDGKLVWIERTPEGVVRHEAEPGTSIWKRAGVRILSWLPIDWLL